MSNNVNQPAFNPVPNGTVNLTAGVASSNVQVRADPRLSRHVRVVNTGAVTAFIEFGPTGVTAVVASSMPIVAGATEIFTSIETFMAAITASGSAVVYVTPGEGL